MTSKWDVRFLEMAKMIATWSRDPSTQVGAVIVDEKKRIVSTGFNGFARGVKDTPQRLDDRKWKYPLTMHAEHNAVLFATREDLSGCALYVTHHPCARCMSVIAQKDIKQVFYCEDLDPERWAEELDVSGSIAEEVGITVQKISL